ncbi:MAG: SagB/ThcOx family dehydrogenase [Patescibacteria group bacterium]|jgi:SagB-type dehydrogenase family enzyme
MDTLHIELADPYEKSEVSVEEAIAKRKSVRHFKDEQLSFQDISQLLWAAYGEGRVPSAGGIYPLRISLIVEKVELMEPGVYRYFPATHSLSEVLDGTVGRQLEQAAFGQIFLKEAAVTIVIAAEYREITRKYGPKGVVFTYMEAGHSGQNIYLQAQSLGLGTVAVGAFDEEKVRVLLNVSEEEEILYLMPVGKPKEGNK